MSDPSWQLFFRQTLKKEIPLWQEQGILDSRQTQLLYELYQLEDITDSTTKANRSFLGGISVLGVSLVGLGAISFVAANWQWIPSLWKVVLLLSVMWGAQGVGFYLWKIRNRYPVLGHGLIFLGSLLYGANIGLFGQIFHLQGTFYQAFLLWAVGALTMAYALQSLPNAYLALGTAFVGYLSWMGDMASSPGILFTYGAWIGLALFWPLAYNLRSEVFYSFLVLAFGFSALFPLLQSNWFFAFNATLLFATFLGILISLWIWIASVLPFKDGEREFRNGGKNLAFLGVVLIGYFYSFWDMASQLVQPIQKGIPWALWLQSGIVLILLITLAIGIVCFFRSVYNSELQVEAIALSIGASAVLGPILLGFGTLFSVVWINLGLLALAAYWLWLGLQKANRGNFLGGMGLSAIIALSRFFEYDTGLLLKSLAFVVIGGALTFAAIWFEKYLNRQENISRENLNNV
jgi:uncharacterized membrane protein